ncbi:MAG: aminopeptidase [Chloroflexi bacterium]|nr:aminopeptidase [Chloroflexota bacterium]
MDTREFERKLKKYADVVVRVGLNLQAGQRLIIRALLDNAEFVHALTESAYEAGARFVSAVWLDEQMDRIRYKKSSLDSMAEMMDWRFDKLVEHLESEDAVLILLNSDPSRTEGIDPEKVGRYQKSWSLAQKPFRDLRGKLVSNCSIVAAPARGWAAKVLPGVTEEERIPTLWELIFEICRVNTDDPVTAWKEHREKLGDWSKYLNNKAYDALKLTGPGTDLTVGLPKGHIWQGGGGVTQNGTAFVANMPTEEVFTMPHRARVDGKVRATKPLNYEGLTDKFSLKFEKGEIVEATAEEGEEHLKNLITTDEGARYIGEIALVPNSSPISQSRRVFYNILYDENAASHMAIGAAYRFSMKDGVSMNAEEFAAAGGNSSGVHADFMIGSGELDVDGIRADGKAEAVMRRGEWVIEV